MDSAAVKEPTRAL